MLYANTLATPHLPTDGASLTPRQGIMTMLNYATSMPSFHSLLLLFKLFIPLLTCCIRFDMRCLFLPHPGPPPLSLQHRQYVLLSLFSILLSYRLLCSLPTLDLCSVP